MREISLETWRCLIYH